MAETAALPILDALARRRAFAAQPASVRGSGKAVMLSASVRQDARGAFAGFIGAVAQPAGCTRRTAAGGRLHAGARPRAAAAARADHRQRRQHQRRKATDPSSRTMPTMPRTSPARDGTCSGWSTIWSTAGDRAARFPAARRADRPGRRGAARGRAAAGARERRGRGDRRAAAGRDRAQRWGISGARCRSWSI